MSNIDYSYLNKPIEEAINKKLAQIGSGGYNGGMDGWQTSVETRLGRIDTDLRHLWWAIIGACVIAVSAFFWTSGQINDLKINTALILQKLDTPRK